MPTSTRFVGKLMKEKAAAAAAASSASTAARRSAWKTSAQKSRGSRDSVESPPQQFGSRKTPGTARDHSGQVWQKLLIYFVLFTASSASRRAASPGSSVISSVSKFAGRLSRRRSIQGKSKAPPAEGSSAPSRGNLSGVQRIGKRSLRFYQKESQEILEGLLFKLRCKKPKQKCVCCVHNHSFRDN